MPHPDLPFVCALGFEVRHAGFFDPYLTPLVQVQRRALIHDPNKIVPDRIAIGIGAEVFLQALAEKIFAHDGFQLFHDHRGFLVNDPSIDRARVFEVVQRLLDAMGAFRAVFPVGRGLMGEQKAEFVVDFRETGIDDLGGHEVGKDFFEPDVVEPVHGDEVAKPHVRGFMGDQTGPAEVLVLRSAFI